jgi:hypothetical protein
MSTRARAWLGGVLFGLGVGAFFAGSLVPGVAALAYAGAGAVVLSLVVIAWAVRDVSRQIGANHALFEAQLRAEAQKEKRDKPPSGT